MIARESLSVALIKLGMTNTAMPIVMAQEGKRVIILARNETEAQMRKRLVYERLLALRVDMTLQGKKILLKNGGAIYFHHQGETEQVFLSYGNREEMYFSL